MINSWGFSNIQSERHKLASMQYLQMPLIIHGGNGSAKGPTEVQGGHEAFNLAGQGLRLLKQ